MEKPTVEPSALAIAPSAITKTPIPTLNPTQTATPTKTNTPFPTNTWTLLPTLSPKEAQERVQVLMTGDEICLLPCWGNIIPGKTSIDEAKAHLNSFAYKIGGTREYISLTILKPDQSGLIINGGTFHIDKRKNIVTFIDTYRYGYRLDQLLNTYGSPAEVWIWADTNISVRPMKIMYQMALYYPSKGFLAIYEGDGEIDDIYNVCPINSNNLNPSLKIWPQEQNLTFEKIVRDSGLGIPEFKQFNNIEKDFGIDMQEFYTLYKEAENEDICIPVPAPW